MMRRSLLLAVLGGALLVGCDDKAKQDAQQGRLFGVVFQTMNNPFFVELNEGIKSVVEAHGDRLTTLDSQWDSNKQRNDISDLILKGAAGVFINPVNWEGITGSLMQAKDRKVPCVVVDAPVKDDSLVLTQVASDNVEAGRLACRALASLKPDAKVVIMRNSINKASIDRVAGFKEEMAKNPQMVLLSEVEQKGTIDDGRKVMSDLHLRFPEMNGAFPINDPSALGVISALESAGKLTDVTVVAVDGSDEAIKAIEAGKLHSTSAQFPREIGRIAAEKVYEHLAGKPVEKDIKVPVKLISKENVAEFLKQE